MLALMDEQTDFERYCRSAENLAGIVPHLIEQGDLALASQRPRRARSRQSHNTGPWPELSARLESAIAVAAGTSLDERARQGGGRRAPRSRARHARSSAMPATPAGRLSSPRRSRSRMRASPWPSSSRAPGRRPAQRRRAGDPMAPSRPGRAPPRRPRATRTRSPPSRRSCSARTSSPAARSSTRWLSVSGPQRQPASRRRAARPASRDGHRRRAGDRAQRRARLGGRCSRRGCRARHRPQRTSLLAKELIGALARTPGACGRRGACQARFAARVHQARPLLRHPVPRRRSAAGAPRGDRTMSTPLRRRGRTRGVPPSGAALPAVAPRLP